MSYLDKLNPTQREAAMHSTGPLLIFAGAGSGKTRVLTYRVARLIEQGVDPYHIIAITFTNKAAREMRERISAITTLGDEVWVSTFHAACTRILRRDIETIGFGSGFSIYDTADSLRLIKDCLKEKNLNESHYPPRFIAQKISAQKNELISPAEYERSVAGDFRDSNIAEVYALYQQRLLESNALDFDDIIFKTVELLSQNEDIRQKYQNRFQYVLVDEYQDTNHAQYELVRLLSGFANNLCVVGDDDQSIYGWRGANIRNILQFEKDYPGAKVIKLEQNYRSSQTILNAANAVISVNQERADKRLWTENHRGEALRLYAARDERDEGAFVARVIADEVKNGAQYSDFAVLYRANSQSRGVEDQLVAAGIPYRIFSGVRFYEHMEIKDILAYLKSINNPADELAFSRIINVPKRGIGAASVDKIKAYAWENGLTFSTAAARAGSIPELGKKSAAVLKFSLFMDECSEFAASNSVVELIQKILDDTDYMLTISDGTPEGEERQANIKEFLAKAQAFENESSDTSLARFLEDVALVADIDNYDEGADAAALLTLHSAKGLEFNTVFLVGFEENLFPSFRSIDSMKTEQMEEERRLCYVGFTRARHRLYLTHAFSRMTYGGVIRNKISRFLQNIPEDCIAPVNMYGEPSKISLSHGSLLSNAPKAARPLRSFTSERGFSEVPRGRERTTRPFPKVTSTTHPHPATEKLKNTATSPAAANESNPPPSPPREFSTKAEKPNFSVGDNIRQAKYGVGEVLAINPAGADYEITVQFPAAGQKKFMANLANLSKC